MRSAQEISASLKLQSATQQAAADSAPAPRSSAPYSPEPQPRTQLSAGIRRVPTHAVGRAHERRAYVRARLALPLRVTRVAGQRDERHSSLHTRDISCSGLFFDYPQTIEPGTPVEFEVLLVDRPLGRGSVRMCTLAHVVRCQDVNKPGWHGVAAVFDDIRYVRDDVCIS